MKNVKPEQIEKYITLYLPELEELLAKLFNDKVYVMEYQHNIDVSFSEYETDLWYDEVLKKLGDYFDVEIINTMLVDDIVYLQYEERD